MTDRVPTILVLGASGLVGQALRHRLMKEDFNVVAVARRFKGAQNPLHGGRQVEAPAVDLDPPSLIALLDRQEADIVVNCIGVLQDSRRGTTGEVHEGFARRLCEAMVLARRTRLLIQISVPGTTEEDSTAFSATKHAAERIIAASGIPYVILRPGFVVAPAAYGGSALVRALATLPFRLPENEAEPPFAAVDVEDIARTVSVVARRWRQGDRQWQVTWDLMERPPGMFGDVVALFRRRLGRPAPRWLLPSWTVHLGARLGDFAALLGWSPPVRSTALAEMRRGVVGDPEPWVAATGIEPSTLRQVLARMPANVQEKWFARLYLLKPLVLGGLSLFWTASGLIALTIAFRAASAVLIHHGFAPFPAAMITAASSLLDILVGVGIAVRRTCKASLLTGIGVSLFYMLGAAILTPEMWIEPLGALVKTAPAIVLMLVALAILEDR